MRSRRRGGSRDPRPRHRTLDRHDVDGGHLEREDGAGVAERPTVLVADPRWVQPAELVACDVDGCTEAAVPEAWGLVDLDTGDEAPGRFCEEHQLAWRTRPRATAGTPA